MPDREGTVLATIRETERIEIDLDSAPNSGRAWRGGQRVGTDIRPLPIGSTLDAGGVFSWLPGPGFIGTYDLVFQASDGNVRKVRIVIEPRFAQKKTGGNPKP